MINKGTININKSTDYSKEKNKNTIGVGENMTKMKQIRQSVNKLTSIKYRQTAIGNTNLIFDSRYKIGIIN